MSSVLITGATSGIGQALVSQYADKGYKVIACGRNREKLARLAEEYRTSQTVCFDMNNYKEMAEALSEITELDLVILNAGDCEYIDDALQFDADLFARIVKTNLISTGYLVQALINKVVSGGRIAFIGSSVTYLPFSRAEAYGASKAGLDYLVRSLSLDLSQHNINVSLIRPGFVRTPLTDRNDFPMPFLMEVADAAKRIVSGLDRGKRIIEFPGRFIWLMRIIGMLPDPLLYRILSRRA